MARFRQIAQLPHAPVETPVPVDGACARTGGGRQVCFRQIPQLPIHLSAPLCGWMGLRGHAGGGPTVRFRKIQQLTHATVGAPVPWGSAVIPAEAPSCVVDKTRSDRMHLSGDQGRRVTRAVMPVKVPRYVLDNCAATPCDRRETGAGGDRAGRSGRARNRPKLREDTKRSLPPATCPDGRTVRPGGVDAGTVAVPALRQGGTPIHWMRIAERRQDEIMRLPRRAYPGDQTVHLGGEAAACGPAPCGRLRSIIPGSIP